tara:strand:+ start:1320 stop:1571 length:252 start_codon:yes stop_codon:yes gene_type:complete
MDTNATPSYKNDIGVPVIKIGVKGFVCIGAEPPNDHPHVYMTMGDKDYKVCLYCNTRFEYDATLSPQYTQPPECYHGDAKLRK